MHVVLASYGSRGDVEPLLGLAEELLARKVEVTLCAPPDLVDLPRALDVAYVPLGWPIRALATGTLSGAPTSFAEVAGTLVPQAYASVLAAAERADAVVATGSLPAVAGAQAAAECLDLPYVHVTFSPCYLSSPYEPPVPWPGMVAPEGADPRTLWELNAAHLEAMAAGPVNAHRRSVGLPEIRGVRDHTATGHPILAADAVLGPWRPSDDPRDTLDVEQTGSWFRPDDRPLPADLEAFLDAGDPPVFVGFGSMPLRASGAGPMASTAVAVVRGAGRRLVLGSGWAGLAADSVDDPAGDCHVVGEVNQPALFARVAAVVHHGGAGTTGTAARAGAPQVIVPQVADQSYWARRVAALGIGARHAGPTPTQASLAEALEIALAPATAATAQTVARAVRHDGAARGADAVERRL